jgi:hypothetical protein
MGQHSRPRGAWSIGSSAPIPDLPALATEGEVRPNAASRSSICAVAHQAYAEERQGRPRHIVPWDTSGENPDAFLVIHHPAPLL